MANYITQSDIEDVFGQDNVITWSNLDNTTDTVNSTRVSAAIAYAEEHVDNRFRGGPYTIPFVGTSGSTPEEVVNWCATLAGVWLYSTRGVDEDEGREGPRIENKAAKVEKDITRFLAGTRRLPAQLSETRPTAPIVTGV